MASPDAARETFVQSQPHFGCWLNARKRDEPPDDSAGRFAQRLLVCDGLDPHRAGIASPHATGDGLSGVAGDAGLNEATGMPAAFPDGLLVARAMNPWAMPEAST